MLYVTTLKNFFFRFLRFILLCMFTWVCTGYLCKYNLLLYVYLFYQVLLPTLKSYENAYLSFTLCMLKMHNNSNIHKDFA